MRHSTVRAAGALHLFPGNLPAHSTGPAGPPASAQAAAGARR